MNITALQQNIAERSSRWVIRTAVSYCAASDMGKPPVETEWVQIRRFYVLHSQTHYLVVVTEGMNSVIQIRAILFEYDHLPHVIENFTITTPRQEMLFLTLQLILLISVIFSGWK